MNAVMTATIAREATLALLAARASGATVCPSEVARALVASGAAAATSNWRDMMPAVHAAVDRLHAEGLIGLSWRGKMLTARDGPYRIRAPGRDQRS